MAQSVAAAIRDIANGTVPSNIEIFKLNERKAVFRTGHSEDITHSFVAKVFFLNRFENRVKYHKYGLDEAANLLIASDRDINTPEVCGYGHINDLLGFVKTNVIILENLDTLSPIGALMRIKSQEECSKVFMRTIPLFVRLYKAGCNHIDVNSSGVMLCRHNLDSEVFLLDFQHAKFYDGPSTEILMFEAGHFAKSCRDWLSTETIDAWFDKLLNAIGTNGTVQRQKMKERFDYYFGTYLSRKERKKVR